jgi:hypothetical protein
MMTFPTDEAWTFFTNNLSDIRSAMENYLPVACMEVPNTRVTEGPNEAPVIRPSGEEQRGSMPLAVKYTLADFDAAVAAKDTPKLYNMMNNAWLRAPEDRTVYRDPGFRAMCNILDFTVTGFVDDHAEDED